ncbi:MAG TPA: hypothetical protein VKV25_10690, partial [Acidimicrobiales bacterium]|nr:hypothetical protein [Acidimicrobiales bacterium]
AAAAVPETVGRAGVLLDDKDPLEVAGRVAEVLGQASRRAELAEAGRRRAEEFALPRTSAAFLAALQEHLGA